MCHCVGVVLVRTSFTVGGVGRVTCSNDGGVADRIEIVSEAGGLMTSQMQNLTLTIDPINDSLHNSDITCRVTRSSDTGSEVFTQTLFVTVDGEGALVYVELTNRVCYELTCPGQLFSHVITK